MFEVGTWITGEDSHKFYGYVTGQTNEYVRFTWRYLIDEHAKWRTTGRRYPHTIKACDPPEEILLDYMKWLVTEAANGKR